MFLIIGGQRKSYSLTSKRKSKVGGPFKESDSIFFIKKILLEKPKKLLKEVFEVNFHQKEKKKGKERE